MASDLANCSHEITPSLCKWTRSELWTNSETWAKIVVRHCWGIHCRELIPRSAQEFLGIFFGELPTRNHPIALQMDLFRIVDQFEQITKNCGEVFLGNSLQGTDP